MNNKSNPIFIKRLLTQSLALALAIPFALPAFAQDADDADEGKQLDGVEVVGSRIKRSSVEGPAPVVVITREDFEREGFRTVGDALQTLTQNTSASFTGDLAVSGFTPNAQVVNLRNLGPGYTLTLINGRRPAQYPQPYNRDNNVVNIRAIPASIVESIEILTGGASAIYGSDAVAGVVNIVLRKNFDGNQIKGSIGTSHDGGGDYGNLEFAGGATGDRWSAVYAFQASHTDPVFANERDFLADTRNGPLGAGFTNPGLQLINIRISNAQPGSALNQNAYYPGQEVCDRFGYTTVTTAARGTYCGGYTQPGSRSIFNEQEFYSGYGHFTFDLSDSLQMFGSATWYKSDSASSSGTEFWGTSGDRFLLTRTGAATSNYFDPQVGAQVQLQRTFNPFELGGEEAATTLFDEKTYDISFGFNGTLFDRFDWEASVAHSEYEYSADRPRLLAKAVHDYFLGPLLGFGGATPGATGNVPIYALNRDRWNTPLTPEQYRALSTRVVNNSKTTSSNFNFTLSGDLFDMPAGPVGFAAVLEAGEQTLDLRSDPRTNQLRPLDDQTIYNLTSSGNTDGERDRYAVGGEIRVPLLDSLTLQAAARYDKYDDITAVDDASTYNIGLEWRPLDVLLLRASYSTSFRAPDMQLVYAEGAASFSTVLDEYACRSGLGLGAPSPATPRTRAQCNVTGDRTIYSAQTLIAGNPLLKEEEGKSFSGGFVWDISDRMSMSVDYYRIKLEDAASALTSAFILENEANCRLGVLPNGQPSPNAPDSAFCQNVTSLVTRLPPAPGTALDGRIDRINSAYINTALVDTSGIDATYRYRFDTDRWGNYGLDLGYSLVLTDKFAQFVANELVDNRDNPANLNQRSRVRGSLSWNYGDWTTTVFGYRYGSNGNNARADFTNAAGGFQGRRLPPYMIYNLTIGKNWGENFNTTLTVNNVLNNQYREDNSFTAYPFFNNFIGADPLGRNYNLSATYKF